MTELSLALLSPECKGEPAPGTETFRWPFSNVYSAFQGVFEGVCWHRKEQIELSLHEIPEKLVKRFLSIPNEADLYGRDWNSPASTDTFTLRDASFSHSTLLEICGTHVTER